MAAGLEEVINYAVVLPLEVGYPDTPDRRITPVAGRREAILGFNGFRPPDHAGEHCLPAAIALLERDHVRP